MLQNAYFFNLLAKISKILTQICKFFDIRKVQKDANLVDLEKCCQTHILLQNFVLIQPRTSPPKFCKISPIFPETRQTSDGSFSAVSTATIARKDAFCSIFQNLQDLHAFAPLGTHFLKKILQNFQKFIKIFENFEILENFLTFFKITKFLANFSKILRFERRGILKIL